MKTKFCILGTLLTASLPAWASLYQYGTVAGGSALGAIPDNNTIGLTESFTASGLNSSISDLTLTIVLQGGDSTDLSGYLRLGNTTGSPSYDLTALVQGTPEVGATTYSVNFGTTAFQTAFTTQNPNDTWTLFFADTVAGDTTTLDGWSLDITAVPEPVNVALGVFGVLFAVGGGIGWYRRRNNAAAV